MRTSRGFSLLELLIALGIFAVLGAMAYGSLDHIARQQQGLAQDYRDWQRFESAVERIADDLRYLSPQPVAGGDPGGAWLQGQLDGAEWTRRRSLGGGEAQTERLRWQDDGQALRRISWAGGEVLTQIQPNISETFGQLRLQLRYIDEQGREHARWPLSEDVGALSAVRFELRADNGWQAERLVRVVQP